MSSNSEERDSAERKADGIPPASPAEAPSPNRPDEAIQVLKPSGVGLAALTLDDLAMLNEEIAGMAKAGLPLDKGLEALAKEMGGGGNLQQITARLAADLQAGLTLPEALQKLTPSIPPFYASLMAAGIRSGRLHDVLATLTVYIRTLSGLYMNIVGALFYPAAVLTLVFVLLMFFCFGVLPLFEGLYAEFRLQVPPTTRLAIILGSHPILFFVMPPAIVIGTLFVCWLWLRRTPNGQRRWSQLLYSIPIAGTLVRSARMAAYTELLGILVRFEVPLPEAIQLAGRASSDPVIRQGTAVIDEEIQQGKTLGEALGQRRLLPTMVTWMLVFGEKQGNLATSLTHVSEMFRRQVDLRANLLRNVLPSFLILFVGVPITVLFLVVTIVPLIALLNGLSGF